MLSTFVLGYAVSEVGGRFAAGTLGPGKTGPAARCGVARASGTGNLAGRAWSWEAEFDADLADLTQLVLRMAAPGEEAGPPAPGGGPQAQA